ncbi:GIY-YIG nuclease family protein [Pararobbsia alpina]|uniref:GIY-YIG nuclease family protein n=1 Tax=Pararobbsia alpina TaxID=621374 RepID=UPI0039A5A864
MTPLAFLVAMAWFLYLIECADDSLYTGIAVDVAARYEQHVKGTGARYTRSRAPRRLLATFELPDRSVASKAEYAVKRLPAATKRLLAGGRLGLSDAIPALDAWIATATASVDTVAVLPESSSDTPAG